MPADALPPPASGLFLEVSFRRLLRACEAVVGGEEEAGGTGAASPLSSHPLTARPDLKGGAWRASPVFHHVSVSVCEERKREPRRRHAWTRGKEMAAHTGVRGKRRGARGHSHWACRPRALSPSHPHSHASLSHPLSQYVETLQDQLADLEATAGPDRLPSPLAAAYRARTDAVAGTLGGRPPPPPCVPVRPEGGGGEAEAEDDGSARPPLSTTEPGAGDDGGAARSALLGGTAAATTPGLAASHARPDPATIRLAPPAPTAGLRKAAASTIHTQRALQEALTDDLVGLAAGLRANAEAGRAAVERRGALVEGADTALEATLASARTAAAGAKLAVRTSRRGFWAACAAFLAVGCVFTATFLYIRATSMLGYSAARVARGAAARAAKAEAKRAAEAAARRGGSGEQVELYRERERE